MFIDNYLKSYIIHQLDKHGREITIDEARKEVFGKASMFAYDGDAVTNVWVDEAMEIPHPNPIQADADGVFPDYVTSDNVRFLIQNSKGESVMDYQPGTMSEEE